ncbi:MAG: DNA internalization-related competence protein ComEC/Rec2 [Firmicutes bacterium]|nr:DNA internalization-related competence protein ComEC/Rec2 [Bacillota bacterium]
MLRRPMIFVAGGLALASFIYSVVNSETSIVLMGLILPAAALCLFGRNKAVVIICISFVVGLVNVNIKSGGQETIEKKENISVTGTVKQVREKTGEKGYLQMELDAGEKMLVNVYKSERKTEEKRSISSPVPGWKIVVTGDISEPDGRRNPRCFDYKLYLKSKGITKIMEADTIEIIDKHPSLSGRLFMVKKTCLDKIKNNGNPETAAMLGGILFGDKTEIDESVTEDFRKNGTAHILAVSGLHIGIIYRFLYLIWGFISKAFTPVPSCKSKVFFIVTTVFLICYTALASFSTSVIRAVIMVIMHMFAGLSGRRYDLGSSAFAVAAASMLVNPWIVYNISFQMSFLAVLTMAVLLPYIKMTFKGVLAAGIAVQLGLGPFMVYTFNSISVISFLINIPVIFLAGITVPAGLCCLVLGFWDFQVIYGFVLSVTDFLCHVLVRLNEVTCIEGITCFNAVSPPVESVVAWYLIMLLLLSEGGRLTLMTKGRKYLAAASAVIIVTSGIFGFITDDEFGDAKAVFVDVGQGSCLCIRSEGKVYLFDGGGKENYNVGNKILKPYLLKNGMSSVDGAFVTHLHTDHYKGICELAKAGMIKRLFVYDGNRCREKRIVRDTGLSKDKITYVHGGMAMNISGECSVHVLMPQAVVSADSVEEDDENSLSLIFRIVFSGRAGETSVLVTGDVNEDAERELCKLWRNFGETVLSVGHHGSRYSTCDELLDCVNPSVAVIQVGENVYGHPTREVLSRLEERNVPVYRNDIDGAVGLKVEGGKIINVSTEIR